MDVECDPKLTFTLTVDIADLQIAIVGGLQELLPGALRKRFPSSAASHPERLGASMASEQRMDLGAAHRPQRTRIKRWSEDGVGLLQRILLICFVRKNTGHSPDRRSQIARKVWAIQA